MSIFNLIQFTMRIQIECFHSREEGSRVAIFFKDQFDFFEFTICCGVTFHSELHRNGDFLTRLVRIRNITLQFEAILAVLLLFRVIIKKLFERACDLDI
ncbi:hypothetical protein D3C87_1798630 [compost metagenome]